MSGELNHSPALVLSELLINLGKATRIGDGSIWPVYTSVLPDTPDVALAVVNTTGQHDGRSMTDGTVFEHYGYQMMGRAVDDNAVWTRMNSIAIALDGVLRQYVPIGSDTYHIQNISRVGTVLYVGFDETSRRRLYSLNGFVCMRQMAGTGSYLSGD